jgi:hypothetical protein
MGPDVSDEEAPLVAGIEPRKELTYSFRSIFKVEIKGLAGLNLAFYVSNKE